MKNLLFAVLCAIVGALFVLVQVFGILSTGEPNSFLILISGLAWIGFVIYFNNYRAKRVMNKEPKVLITDGLPSYAVACEQAFPNTQHIRKITLDGKVHNNNKMERLNGEIRDREKTMRGLKKKRTVILQGYQIYHNYIRPHEALDGKTPADLCGIDIKGQNKWLTLIQNASKNRTEV
jgi:hypothetical protein